MHSGFAFLELGTVRKKNQVNALVKILCDFAVSTIAYFFIGYGVAYGVEFLGRRRAPRREKRLRTDQVLLPADVCGGGAGDRLRRHCRARQVQPATRGDLSDRRFRLSVLRRHRVERPVRRAGVARGGRRREISRLRRLGRGACGRRLDRPDGGAAARRAPRPLYARTAGSARIRRRAFRFSRSAPGSCRSAGSVST